MNRAHRFHHNALLLVMLTDMYIPQFRPFGVFHIHASPDSPIRNLRPPIPAEHIMGFPQCPIPQHGTGRRIGDIAAFRLFLYVSYGGVQINLQIILFPHLSFDVKAPGSVHILYLSQQFSVQINIAYRIYPLKHQAKFIRFQNLFRNRKTALIAIILPEKLPHLILIRPPVRFLCHAIFQHFRQDAARHMRLYGLIPAGGVQIPYSI